MAENKSTVFKTSEGSSNSLVFPAPLSHQEPFPGQKLVRLGC